MAEIERGTNVPNAWPLEEPDRDDKSDNHVSDNELTPAERARLRKIYRWLDIRIIPAFWVFYFLCSAVRANVGLAITMNTDNGHDLGTYFGLSSRQIATGLALFYAGYVVFEVPSNLAMSKLSPSKWLARIVISVGVIGTAMVGMRNAGGYYALRLLLGVVEAGIWPGMSLFMTMYYPPQRMAKRIGWYFTASQVSAATVGLVSAGFQKMDGAAGLVGFQWMFLLWGLVTLIVGFTLLWWLPDRPLAPGETRQSNRWLGWLPEAPPVLEGEDALLHYKDLRSAYDNRNWTMQDLWKVCIDWRFWPPFVMYFGVVGVGNGLQSYGTVLLSAINPDFSGIELSLLYAPIWICDLIGILTFTPISDRFHNQRALLFTIPTSLQITGLLVALYAGESTSDRWGRYGGILLVGFGLGSTVPITMAWTAQVMQPIHGEIGVAAALALVSGLGNLGSVVTNYSLFRGWAGDADSSPAYLGSMWVMVGMLLLSIASSWVMTLLLKVTDKRRRTGNS